MKNLNLEHIKQQVAASIETTNEGYKWIKMFPHQLCLNCGWDKPEYDQYLLKHCAGTLTGIEKECFETLYLGIQRILAEMEALSMRTNAQGRPCIPAISCKYTTELWNPVSFNSKSEKQIHQIDKLKVLKQQQDADEETPIKL